VTKPSEISQTEIAKKAGEGHPRPKLARTRTVTSWILIVMVGIFAPITILSGWAIKTVTNTDRYVATLQPLARDKAITTYIANTATAKLFADGRIEAKVAEALPKPTKFLATPLTAELERSTNKIFLKGLQSSWFPKLWDRENRFTHGTAVAILQGKSTPALNRARALAINVTPALEQANQTLNERGITVFNPIVRRLVSKHAVSVNLATAKQLEQAQGLFRFVIDFRLMLVAVFLVLAALAIAIARRRRVTLTRVLVATALGCCLTLVGLTFARSSFIGLAPADAQAAAGAIFDTVLRFFHAALRSSFVVAGILAAISWATGPTPRAITLRAAVAKGSSRSLEAARGAAESQKAQEAAAHLNTAALWLSERASAILVGLGAILAIVLAFATKPGTLWWALTIGILISALLALSRWRAEHQEGR